MTPYNQDNESDWVEYQGWVKLTAAEKRAFNAYSDWVKQLPVTND